MPDCQVGRKIQVGIGKETTPGTAVAAGYWVRTDDKNINPRKTVANDDAADGTIEGEGLSEDVQNWSEPTFDGIIRDEFIGLLFLALLGQVSTTADTPEAGVNTHEFTLDDDSNAHPSLTVWFEDALLKKIAPYAMLQNLSIQIVADNFARVVASFIASQVATSDSTPAYSQENKFKPSQVTVKVADNLAGLAAANAIPVQALNLNFDKAPEAYFATGSKPPTKICNGTYRMAGDLALRIPDSNFFDWFEAGTKKAMRITIENTDVTIGAATNPKIEIDIGRVNFEDWGRDTSNDSFIIQNVGFKQEKPASDQSIKITLINTVASY